MSTFSKPSLLYRSAARQAFFGYHAPSGVDPDDYFRYFLEERYREAKTEPALPKVDMTSTRLDLFVIAAGLLTYGRLDVFEDILDNIPPDRVKIRRLAYSLKILLPLPDALDPVEQSEAVKQWIRENSQHLKWDEEEGRFVWENKMNRH